MTERRGIRKKRKSKRRSVSSRRGGFECRRPLRWGMELRKKPQHFVTTGRLGKAYRALLGGESQRKKLQAETFWRPQLRGSSSGVVQIQKTNQLKKSASFFACEGGGTEGSFRTSREILARSDREGGKRDHQAGRDGGGGEFQKGGLTEPRNVLIHNVTMKRNSERKDPKGRGMHKGAGDKTIPLLQRSTQDERISKGGKTGKRRGGECRGGHGKVSNWKTHPGK